MKKTALIVFLFFVASNTSIAQKKPASSFCGTWVNTQYEYYKKLGASQEFLYNISPWTLNVDTFGKCTVQLLFERRWELGYPVRENTWNNGVTYYYKSHKVWLRTIKDHDSLLVYCNSGMQYAGIIFRSYN